MNLIDGWFSSKIKKVGFEDIQYAVSRRGQGHYIMINTMNVSEQDCLIQHTLDIHLEEKTINDLLENYQMKKIHIIVYGKNNTDETVERKYQQLTSLGFSQVYLYYGGLFEWLLLQDVYGEGEFPTTRKILDILKYRPLPLF